MKKVLTCIAAATLALAACSSNASSSGGSNSAAKGPVTGTDAPCKNYDGSGKESQPVDSLQLSSADLAKLKAGHYTAAMAWHESSAFVTSLTQAATAEFKTLGISVTAVTNANFDAGRQKSDIQTIMAKKPNLLLSLPVDPVVDAAAFRGAAAAGTKIVYLSNLPAGAVYPRDYTTVVTDNLCQMGQAAARAMNWAIGGKGEIAYMPYSADPNYYPTREWDETFLKTIKAKYPNIKVVVTKPMVADPAQAQATAAAVLVQHPNLDGIFASFDTPLADSVLAALKAAGNHHTRLVAVGYDDPLALSLAQGGSVAAMVIDNAYAIGTAMAKAAAYSLLGRPVPSFLTTGVDPIITKDNVLEGYHTLHMKVPSDVSSITGGK
ncbi:MAG TPA: substrate-binding domain-containing protein [Jatrophihabitans sp.]|nr:substrate-binding domain-containing protein [Jatrophihabitans sp.]